MKYILLVLLAAFVNASTHAGELPSQSPAKTKRKPRISNAQLQRLRREQRNVAVHQSEKLLYRLPNKKEDIQNRSGHLLLATADPNPVHIQENAQTISCHTIQGFLLSAFYLNAGHPNLIRDNPEYLPKHWIEEKNRTQEPGTATPLNELPEISESENEYISF